MGLVFIFAYIAYTHDADHALPMRGRRGGRAWRLRAVSTHPPGCDRVGR